MSVPAEEEVLEGIVVEHEGLPFGNRGWVGWEFPTNHYIATDGTRQSTSAHFVLREDGTIQQVAYPQEWK